MAATEGDIIRDEQERSNLLGVISDVEAAMVAATPGARHVLENTVENARKRVGTLDKKIEEAKVEHAAEVQALAVTAAALAAKETKLSAGERETYRGFLQESFFTKRDFGKLDEFYTHSWDRLSEGGKDEMSKRIDEGVRRGEFKFSDLSETVQEKETAHRAAKASKAASVEADASKGEKDARPAKPAEASAIRDINLGSVDLSGIQLADGAGSSVASSLPDISGSSAIRR